MVLEFIDHGIYIGHVYSNGGLFLAQRKCLILEDISPEKNVSFRKKHHLQSCTWYGAPYGQLRKK